MKERKKYGNRKAVSAALAFGVLTVATLFLLGCTDIFKEPPKDPLPANTYESDTSQSGIYGNVISKSDVQTIPDAPIKALVFAIPANKIDSLLREVGVYAKSRATVYSEDRFKRLEFSLPEETFNQYSETHTYSDTSGAYTLSLSPGEYIVCIANFYKDQMLEGWPAHVPGCSTEINLQENERVRKNISHGEAGVSSE